MGSSLNYGSNLGVPVFRVPQYLGDIRRDPNTEKGCSIFGIWGGPLALGLGVPDSEASHRGQGWTWGSELRALGSLRHPEGKNPDLEILALPSKRT